jgi:hypothetical protein
MDPQKLSFQTDPDSYMLTGEPKLVHRMPDAISGLATFSERDAENLIWAYELMWEILEMRTPYRSETGRDKPSVSVRGIRPQPQASVAVTAYLGLLDDLVRRPGPVGSAT